MFGCLSLNENFWFNIGLPVCNLSAPEDADYLSNEILETLVSLEKKNMNKNTYFKKC